MPLHRHRREAVEKQDQTIAKNFNNCQTKIYEKSFQVKWNEFKSSVSKTLTRYGIGWTRIKLFLITLVLIYIAIVWMNFYECVNKKEKEARSGTTEPHMFHYTGTLLWPGQCGIKTCRCQNGIENKMECSKVFKKLDPEITAIDQCFECEAGYGIPVVVNDTSKDFYTRHECQKQTCVCQGNGKTDEENCTMEEASQCKKCHAGQTLDTRISLDKKIINQCVDANADNATSDPTTSRKKRQIEISRRKDDLNQFNMDQAISEMYANENILDHYQDNFCLPAQNSSTNPILQQYTRIKCDHHIDFSFTPVLDLSKLDDRFKCQYNAFQSESDDDDTDNETENGQNIWCFLDDDQRKIYQRQLRQNLRLIDLIASKAGAGSEIATFLDKVKSGDLRTPPPLGHFC